MDAAPRLRPYSVPHRAYLRTEEADAPVSRRALLAQGLWLGLLSGWLELAVLLAHRSLVGNVTDVSRRLHWYHAPLGVLAHLALMAAWWPLALAIRWRDPRSPRRDLVAAGLAWYLAILSPLLAIEELYWPCAHMLAATFAVRVAPGWRRRREGLLRRTLPAMGVASALLLVGGIAWQFSAERRALATLPPSREGSPNVVLIVLDTVRADHLGLYGYGRETSPRLSSLADRGITFDFARSTASWTLPSHASMFTGRWPHELSVDADRPLDGSFPTLAEFLGRQGYRTGGFTANTYYTNAWHGIDRGFARYEDAVENRTFSVQETLRCAAVLRRAMPWLVRLGLFPMRGDIPQRRPAAEIRRDAMGWLSERGPDRPFFLFLNFFDAHDLYEIPPGHSPRFSHESKEAIQGANRDYFRHMKGDGDKAKAATARRVLIDVYDDCLLYLDDQVGRLLDDLERRGLLSHTWVIVTADHGEFFGEKGHFGHGSGLDRPVLDVPLLIVPPGGRMSSTRVAAPVSLRDLPATVSDLIGSGDRSPFPGRSLRRFWEGHTPAAPDEAPLSEQKVSGGPGPGRTFDAVVVSGDRILHANQSRPDELYSTDDRAEARNLAPQPGEHPTLERLHALLRDLMRGAR